MNYRQIKTKKGIPAIVVNNMIIRLSETKTRMVDDEESFEEYKVRQRLIPKLKKHFKVKEVNKPKEVISKTK